MMKAGDKFHTLTVTGLEFSCKFTTKPFAVLLCELFLF